MIKQTEPLPKGFICRCGVQYRFTPYVYAHWDVKLTFECDGCGKWIILRGNAQNRYVRAEPFFDELAEPEGDWDG